MAVSTEIMRRCGVAVDEIRAVDHDIAPGVQPDMTEHGLAHDDWPTISQRVLAADILVIGTPIGSTRCPDSSTSRTSRSSTAGRPG
jgi:multimeric flavodoxin WrbA